MQWFKLKNLYPWWTVTFRSQYPLDHVETIVDSLKETYGEMWEEFTVKNVEWKSEEECWMLGSYESLPTYCKVLRGNAVYYYYLYDKNEIVAENTNGLVYRGKYILDKYMTKFQHKLSILINHDPIVKFNHKYCNRFQKDANNDWYIDFVEQKWLSSYTANNNEKVRNLAYYTDEATLYANNFPTIEKPTTITLYNYATAAEWEITNFNTLLTTPSNTGRYRYLICKSSAKVSTNNSSITPISTTQTILVIPLWDNSILHGINDINITESQVGALSCLGDNMIGFWECDLPYSFLYGMSQSDSTNVAMRYGTNKTYGATETTQTTNIPFFELPLNYFKKFKLIDFSQYSQGFAGRMINMIYNLDKWNPDTEPALFAPQNYSEVYNNGVGSITNDMSYFIFKWAGTSSLEHIKDWVANGTVPNDDPAFISMYCAFGFDDGLNIAYDFGDYTNTKLASYDNTEVITSSVSIQNQILGSAAANYYSSNVNTGLTSVQNRKSEQAQAWVDASLNAATAVADVAIQTGKAKGIIGKITTAAGATAKAAIQITKIMEDTAMQQERANRELASQTNNIYSSPATVVGNPYIKGIIPNNNVLFKTYSYELHPLDKTKIFSDILEHGRIYDAMDSLSAFNNNVYMNVLDINPRPTYTALLDMVLTEDTSIFNNPSDNDEFFIWLGQPHHIYNTYYPINVLNYQASDYIDNIEKIVYPTMKTHISRVITNIPENIRAEASLALIDLRAANPEAPEAIWSQIEILINAANYLTIKVTESTDYYGTIIAPSNCYNGYIIDGNTNHYFFNPSLLCAPVDPTYGSIESDWYIYCPDGTTYHNTEFNKEIVFNEITTFNTIPDNFLAYCSNFNKPLSLGKNTRIIADYFLYNCTLFNSSVVFSHDVGNIEIYNTFMENCSSFNQTIDLSNVRVILSWFMKGCSSFNQNLDLTSLTRVTHGFMYNCNSMISTININDILPTIFESNYWTLATSNSSSPCYTTGITITGTNKAAFLSRFPNSNESPYRKLK